MKNKNLFEVRFKRQHPIDIFIADFYCHKYKLVIEVDGEIHTTPEQRQWDENRTAEIEKYGLTVIRFTNHEVMNQLNHVLDILRDYVIHFRSQ